MNTLKAYLRSHYWRRTFFANETFAALFAALGFFWLLTEIAAFIVESWKVQLQALWAYFLAISAAYTIWRRRPVMAVCERLNGSDIRIEIRIADILTLDTALVVSTNTSFDTAVNERLISARSLQGEFTRTWYDKSEHLDADLNVALQSEQAVSNRDSNVGGKQALYRIGTVAMVAPKGKTTYLLAISDLNADGVARSSYENVKEALAALWSYVSSKGRFEPLAIPILGTGHGRINVPRDAVIREIIKSFVAACSERKFTSMLTVVISPSDYHTHELDIHDLGEFLRHVCRYTEVSSSRQGGGTATE